MAIRDAAGNQYYATTDRIGSVRSIAKRDGTWLMSQRFDPYGRRIARDSVGTFTWGSTLRYGWTGREYDAETGFSFHRARYFDPASRRWTQEDPIGYGGGGNLYAYASGSPMEARDPSGMIPSSDEVNRRLRAAAVDPMAAQGIFSHDWDGFFGVTLSSWRVQDYCRIPESHVCGMQLRRRTAEALSGAFPRTLNPAERKAAEPVCRVTDCDQVLIWEIAVAGSPAFGPPLG